jgi:hypothetical protein
MATMTLVQLAKHLIPRYDACNFTYLILHLCLANQN